jgi:hypothetical protein
MRDAKRDGETRSGEEQEAKMDCFYSLDRGRGSAYCQRTLAGAPGASPFPRLPTRLKPYPRALREVCDAGDDERPSSVLRRAACQRESRRIQSC